MYQLISAIGRSTISDGRWEEIEIGEMAINAIFSTYRRVFVTLSNSFLPDPVGLDIEVLRREHGSKEITFNQLLLDLAGASLPTTSPPKTINTRTAKFADAFHAGYKARPTHPWSHPDAQYPPSEKTWLYLTRPNTDYRLFYESCLVSINGYYHLIDYDATGIYIKDAVTSLNVSHENQIGLYSFRELGKLQYIPITAQMLYKQNPDQFYRDRCYVDLGVDVSNKTVMLVLGGYLHILDEKTLLQVGDSLMRIDFNNLSLFARYFESLPYLDFSSLPIERTLQNASQIGVNDFLSDANLAAYLTLSQSFFVVLDNTELFKRKHAVRKSPMPGIYTAYSAPKYPLIIGTGRQSDYWCVPGDGQYALTCVEARQSRRVFDTTDPLLTNSISDARITVDPVRFSDAFLLEVGSDI